MQQRLMQSLPLGVTAWLYNMRRIARLIMPTRPFPLADQNNSLSCQPLLFVSSGRAGTTLLRSMLVMSGELAIPPETETLPMMMMQFASMQELGWRNLSRMVISLMETSYTYELWDIELNELYRRAKALPPNEQSVARLIDIIYLYYAECHFPNATVWGDQTPDNIFYYRWFLEVFPKAKYLHVLRDGRDVASSLMKMGLGDIDYAVDRWIKSMHIADKIKQSVAPDQFLEVRYKDLVMDTQGTLQRICTFAGIQYDPIMLEYWRSDSTVEHKKFSHHENLKQPVFNSSIGRWRERLSPEEQQIANTRMKTLLEQYGYE